MTVSIMETKKFVGGSLLVMALFAGCSDDTTPDSTSTTTTSMAGTTTSTAPAIKTVMVDITVGQNAGPNFKESVVVGTEVVLNFLNLNADDEFHLHDYDLTTGHVKKGIKSSISFVADKVGEFEVESHVTEEVLFILIVTAS